LRTPFSLLRPSPLHLAPAHPPMCLAESPGQSYLGVRIRASLQHTPPSKIGRLEGREGLVTE
jgi:hypothetical protein